MLRVSLAGVRRLAFFGLCLLWQIAPVGAQLRMSCHIHPPDTDSGETPAIIGPFTDAAGCQAERQQRFGDRGRCHCTAGFASPPGWGRPSDGRETMDGTAAPSVP